MFRGLLMVSEGVIEDFPHETGIAQYTGFTVRLEDFASYDGLLNQARIYNQALS